MRATARWTAWLPACERALVPLGLVALAYYGASVGVEKLYQSRSKRSLEKDAGERAAVTTTALSLADRVLGFEPPLGRLEIPAIDLDVVVLEGIDRADLNRGVGHIPGTSPLGNESGNIGIAGHRDGFFRRLESLSQGDRMFVTTPEGRAEYRVSELRIVAPDEVGVLEAGGTPRLTLVTCFPFRYVGTAPKRYVVIADRSS
jgi:LPXTG-site transpeptidase (sortase) family protein